MHLMCINALTACACLVLFLSVDDVKGYNTSSYGEDTYRSKINRSLPLVYHDYCSFNTECDTANLQYCDKISARCECIPNTVYNQPTKECLIFKCDEAYQSCPYEFQCIAGVCTKFCDMVSNNCTPDEIYKYYTRKEFLYGLIAEVAIGSLAILITLLVFLIRCCRKRNARKLAKEQQASGGDAVGDDDILVDGAPKKPSNVYAFFMCFSGEQPQ